VLRSCLRKSARIRSGVAHWISGLEGGNVVQSLGGSMSIHYKIEYENSVSKGCSSAAGFREVRFHAIASTTNSTTYRRKSHRLPKQRLLACEPLSQATIDFQDPGHCNFQKQFGLGIPRPRRPVAPERMPMIACCRASTWKNKMVVSCRDATTK
jgi:hypothetical protein